MGEETKKLEEKLLKIVENLVIAKWTTFSHLLIEV